MTNTRYDEIAEWFDARVRSGAMIDGFIKPHLFEMLGDIRGLDICDLACGQGRIARELARRGANVIGVDISFKLLTFAQRDEKTDPLGIIYLLDDAETLYAIASETFDVVICHLALMDIAHVEATFQAVFRILRSKGWFIFSITHPCFEAPHSMWTTRPNGGVAREVHSYFKEGFWISKNIKGIRGRAGAYHRTLSTYITSLIRAGFTIDHMVEPPATGRAVDLIPGYVVVPGILMIRCRKG